MRRHGPLLAHISEREPVHRRVLQLIEVRSQFFEATVPFTRALAAQSLVGPAVEEAVRVSRNALRLQHRDIERLFKQELGHLSAKERSEVVEAMSAAASPVVWEYLRRSRGNSVPRACAIVERSLTSILRDVGVDA